MSRRVILDTNIIIHREENRSMVEDIGYLYRLMDQLKYRKMLHPIVKSEILEYGNNEYKKRNAIKLDSYEEIKYEISCFDEDSNFRNKIKNITHEKDYNDDILLYDIFLGKNDILITQDKKMKRKAEALSISSQVMNIDEFIMDMQAQIPNYTDEILYSIHKTYIGNLDYTSLFFDSFKKEYGATDFTRWLNSKSNEEAYVCYNEKNDLSGFLYLKVESADESYNEFTPVFASRKRLKVGSFKVDTVGKRISERFLKHIFASAQQNDVDEIYFTCFNHTEEHKKFIGIMNKWGFKHFGKKGEEEVYVKRMNYYDPGSTVQSNFPIVNKNVKKFILPILSDYHTQLFPDSILLTENKYILKEDSPQYYALKKVYISFKDERVANVGDLVLIYRIGAHDKIKKYASTITTLCVINKIYPKPTDFNTMKSICKDRSVFSDDDIYSFYKNNRSLTIVELIPITSLNKNVILNELYQLEVIEENKGPRPFHQVSDYEFECIMTLSKTVF